MASRSDYLSDLGSAAEFQSSGQNYSHPTADRNRESRAHLVEGRLALFASDMGVGPHRLPRNAQRGKLVPAEPSILSNDSLAC